jgi:hypothetical protein
MRYSHSSACCRADEPREPEIAAEPDYEAEQHFSIHADTLIQRGAQLSTAIRVCEVCRKWAQAQFA